MSASLRPSSLPPDSIRPNLVDALAGEGPVITESTRNVADGGRIRILLVAFNVALLVGLASLMLLLVSSIFARLTPSIRKDLENAGARWVDREVVEDGELITSRKPQDAEAFSRALLKALEHKPAGRR